MSRPLCAAIVTIALIAACGAAARAATFPSVAIPTVTNIPSLDPNADLSTWSSAATVKLQWDVVHRRPVTEATTVYAETDGRYLYLRFDAAQAEPIAASQRTNDVGQGTDDDVWVDLWPDGISGYTYQFFATPLGTHYESSSENTSFSPAWDAAGARKPGGYTVTMRIPLNVIRGARSGSGWRVNFARFIHATGDDQVWSYDAEQSSPDDFARSAGMTMAISVAAPRPKPRLAVYGLGAIAAPSAGGSTSRTGLDLSIPVTSTAAFYATFHPDFSNVELDQQTISPTVYQRYYSEVRPFFTQAASFYNDFNCDACPNITTLYTPAIPTPREGYAIEGKQGPISFASFDSVGEDRSDIASALTWSSSDTRWFSTLQRVSADLPGAIDDSEEAGIGFYDLKHLSAYFNYGTDAGTFVPNPSQAHWYDFGGGWANSTFGLFGSTRQIGQYFDPIDGFISHPGIAGYALYSAKIWDFDAHDKLATIGVAGFIDRYQGPSFGIAQSDNSLLLDVLTRSALDLQLFTGSNYWRFGTLLTPVSQNAGFSFTYHSGSTTNNPGNFPYHGSSATPTSISYATGRYGNGRLDTWFRTTTMRAGMRGTLTFALDDAAQWLPVGHDNVQWFESVSYTYQLDPNSSFAIGLRREVGMPPIPNGGGDCIGVCSNVSVAYHLRRPHWELYAAYGDPNTLSTVPQALLKLIFYAGAEKGT